MEGKQIQMAPVYPLYTSCILPVYTPYTHFVNGMYQRSVYCVYRCKLNHYFNYLQIIFGKEIIFWV